MPAAMQGRSALGLAFDLLRNPTLAKGMRQAPLPHDVLRLLKIAGGSEEARRVAAEEAGRRTPDVEMAAVFYIEQVLLYPGADCYRILGASPATPPDVIRAHRNWMLRWIHPDHNGNEWERALAYRVIGAWDEIRRGGGAEEALSSRNLTVARPVPHRNHHRARPRQSARFRAAPPWIPLPVAARRGRRRALLLGLFLAVAITGAVAVNHLYPHGF
jgi:hypothetical protein